jgi:hypothetical protein
MDVRYYNNHKNPTNLWDFNIFKYSTKPPSNPDGPDQAIVAGNDRGGPDTADDVFEAVQTVKLLSVVSAGSTRLRAAKKSGRGQYALLE